MGPAARKASFSLLRGSWEATADDRFGLFVFVLLFILANALDLMIPWAMGGILKVAAQGQLSPDAFSAIIAWVLFYTSLRMGNLVLHHSARYVQAKVTYLAKMHAITELFGAMMRYPLRWHIRNHSGDSLSKLHRAEGAVANVVGTYTWQIIEGSVKVFGAAVVIIALDPLVALVVVSMAIFTIGLMILFNTRLTEKIRSNNQFGNKLNRISVDYLVNVVTVKTLGLESQATRYLRSQRDEGFGIATKIAKYMELKWGATGLGHGLVVGLALLVYFFSHSRSNTAVDVQEVVALMSYLDRIFQAIASFTGYYSGLVEASTAYEDADQILSEESRLEFGHQPVRKIESDWKSLEIRGLNFSYAHGERGGLRSIDLDIRHGEKIALVGHSGGGKSTFLKVLAGLLTPDSYSLSIDGLVGTNIECLVRECLLIPQEPEIFSESVKYNLTMGDDFDPKELQFFISLCKLDRMMARLPHGIDSDLAEKGLNLSVGEKQRVALARGLLRAVGRSLILLDEPTSSLDPKNEKDIYLGLLYHFSDKVILSACHRLNLVPMFDKVVMFEQGSILEAGSFSELLDKKGYFARAWDDYQSKISSGAGNLGDLSDK